MDEFKSNSHRSKALEKENAIEQEKRVEKAAVTNAATTKKKSGVRKFANTFISEDAVNVKSYVIGDVLIPAIKKAISDIVRDGIDMILYGDSNRSRGKSSGNYVSYSSYSNRDRRDDRYSAESRSRASRFDEEDFIYETRGEAERVLDQLDGIIARYGFARVADIYDLSKLVPPYTSNNYGWTSVRNVTPKRMRDGRYILEMPHPMPID